MRKLAIFSLGFSLAAAFYVYLRLDTPALVVAGVCLILAVFFCRRRRTWLRRLGIVSLGAAIGILWCFVYQQIVLAPVCRAAGTEGQFSVQAVDVPTSRYGSTVVEGTLRLEGRKFHVLLYGDETLQNITPGDWIFVTASAELADRTFHQRSQGNALMLLCQGECSIVPGAPSWSCRVRTWLQMRIDALYSGQTAAFLRALLTGDRSRLSLETEWELETAGILHAVAVSGMHVSILLSMLTFVCGRNPRMTAFFGIPLVLFFAVMTGASPSVCRAAVMQILFLTAPLFGREQDSFTTLGIAALALLLQNPWVISSLSFQLSFAAVAGLFLCEAPMEQKLLNCQKKPSKLWKLLSASTATTLSATILTLPLLILYFQMISAAAVLTNLLCLWAVTWVFVLGLLSAILGPVGTAPAWLAAWLTKYILWLSGGIASVPFAAAYVQGPVYFTWAVCAYGIVFWLLLRKGKRHTAAVLAVLTLGFAASVTVQCRQFSRGTFSFTALDVGQGQCLVLESNGFTAMVDCGGSASGRGELGVRHLRSGGVNRLDVLILSHYDWDHAGGVPLLLRCVQVENLFLPDIPDDTGLREWIEDTAEEKGCRVHYVREKTKITDSEVELLLYPPIYGEKDNDRSIPVLATAAEYVILIPSDLSANGERKLLADQDLPHVDLLVAGHHGAKNATTGALLETVTPSAVIVSVGRDNLYGHPAPETLSRIQDAGAELFRTDLRGDICIRK